MNGRSSWGALSVRFPGAMNHLFLGWRYRGWQPGGPFLSEWKSVSHLFGVEKELRERQAIDILRFCHESFSAIAPRFCRANQLCGPWSASVEIQTLIPVRSGRPLFL
jgi:hypothetical protein